jgi:hypothetical protein
VCTEPDGAQVPAEDWVTGKRKTREECVVHHLVLLHKISSVVKISLSPLSVGVLLWYLNVRTVLGGLA